MAETLARSPVQDLRLRAAGAELDRRLRAGESQAAEAVLAAFPELAADADCALQLIYDELVQREHRGEQPAYGEYYQRFPQWREELRKSFDIHEALVRRSSESFSQASTVVHPREATPTKDQSGWHRYELLDEVGRGGMGVVYRARQPGLNRVVALKMVLAGEFAGAEEQARFRREAETAARLRHPNIVQVYEVGDQDGRPFLAMEYVEGGSLAQRLRGTLLTVPEAARLVETLARAVQHAHEHRVLHRDLKPANILLEGDRDGPIGEAFLTPKITDFGLAKRLSGGPEVSTAAGQTQTGMILGTPSYMAPEQACGNSEGKWPEGVGPAADVWALGAILYEALTGRPPFRGDTVMETLFQVQEKEPLPPRRLRPQTPRDLETICLKCLEKTPERRYPSAWELAEDLRRFQAGESIRARPVGVWGRSWKWARRRPALAALLALVSLVATVGFPAATWLWRRAEADRQQAVAMTGEAQKARADEAARADELSAALARNEVMLAYREWSANNLEQAEDLLARVPPHRRHWEWRYVNQLCHSDLLTLRGHAGQVWCVAYSPDGQRLASAGGDQWTAHTGDVRIWDPNTGEQLQWFRGHSGPVRGLAYSPDGQRIASASYVRGRRGTSEVKIWEVKSGKELVNLAVDPSRGAILGLAFSPDGGRLATAASDGVVAVWDAATGQQLWAVNWRRAMVDSVAFSPDGARLAASCRDTNVGLWDAATGAELRTLPAGNSAMCVCFSPDGRRLAAAVYDHTVRVWDPATGEVLRTYRGHTSPVQVVGFSPDGHRLASIEASGTLKIWSALTGQDVLTIRGNTRWTWSLSFSPDGRRLATGLHDGTVRLWSLTTEQDSRILAGSWVRIPSLAFSPDGQRIVGATPWSVRAAKPHGGVWDLVSGKTLHTLEHKNPVRGVAYSPDGRWLATASDDRTAKLWDAQTGQVIHTLTGHTQAVTCVAFSPDSLHVATGSLDGTVRIWDVASGRGLRTCSGHSAAVNRLAYSPDGRHLASAGEDRAVRIWDPSTGQAVAALDGHAAAVTCVAISPNGRHLASASGKLVFLWDWAAVLQSVTAGGASTPPASPPRLTLQGHADKVHDLAFTPDGHRMASSSEDWTVKVWDMETGSLALTLADFGEVAHSVAFSPNGQLLVAGTTWNRVRVWDAEDPTPGAKAARRDAQALRAWDWHQRAATACELSGSAFAAAFHLSRLIDAPPANELADLYRRRGRAYCGLAEWERAAADFAQAQALPPDDHWFWQDLAAVLLLRGDTDGHHRFCDRLLAQGQDTKIPLLPYHLARICVQSPHPGADPGRALQLARQAVAAQPNSGWALHTLGLAHYRGGQFDEAVRGFQASLTKHPQWDAHVVDWLGLALAHHRLGQADEARRWLDKATRWLDEEAPKLPTKLSSPFPIHPHDWLGSLLLRREAEALLTRTKP